MFKLLKGALLYTPSCIGQKDVLIFSDKIAWIGDDSTYFEKMPEVEVIHADGKLLTPGFIDQHVHITGGGGEGGFSTRTPEVDISDLVEGGITTVIGVLGTDGVTRNTESLYAKAKALETEGITTYIYSGSYQLPVLTITDSIQRDLVFIDKVVGVGEIAIADHRSFQPTVTELSRIASEARNGGLIAKKAGVVHIHLGSGKDGFKLIEDTMNATDLPGSQFVVTHVNRSLITLKQAGKFTETGGVIDLSAGFEVNEMWKDCIPAYDAFKLLRDWGIREEQITMSSDGNGSIPVFDFLGEIIEVKAESCKVLLNDLRKMIVDSNIPLENVLKLVTENPARVLKLQNSKGSIKVGWDADVNIFDDNLNLEMVVAKGRVVVKDGKYNQGG